MKFRDASKELPEVSCRCLTISKNGVLAELEYSAKHKVFNALDFNTPEQAAKYSIEVAVWIPKLEFLSEVEYV